jgi:hypothetical protein
MKRLGGGWLAAEPMLEGEEPLASWSANRTQSAKRAVGGKLWVTTHRVVFLPHRLDAATGGQKWVAQRSEIAGIGRQAAGGDTLGGGLRDRLQLTLTNGDRQLFVVNRLERVVADLTAAVRPGAR